MTRRHSFAPGEWYHCYNRGVEKRTTFLRQADFKRFVLLLYTCNSTEPFQNVTRRQEDLAEIVSNKRRAGTPLVSIGAYCLMPNHFHLIVKEVEEEGVGRFMQRAMTGYTMYFNKKYERTGPLFSGVFKSRHIDDDRYLQHVLSYVHLNPLDISSVTPATLKQYSYSSFPDFGSIVSRVERNILSPEIFELADQQVRVEELLRLAEGCSDPT